MVFEHWDAKNRANITAFNRCNEHRITFCIPPLRPNILDLRYLLRPCHARKDCFRTRPNRFTPHNRSVIRPQTLESCDVKGITVIEVENSEFGLADARGVPQDSVEDRLQVAW